MESIKSYQRLVKLGFLPQQIERLRQLRYAHANRKQVQMIEEQRRLEFARWLVKTGRMSDEFPVLSMPLSGGLEPSPRLP